MRAAYKDLFFDENGSLAGRMETVAATYSDSETVQTVIAFMRQDNSRGFCRAIAFVMAAHRTSSDSSGDGALGIIAGRGLLPVQLARACQRNGRDCFYYRA